MKESGSNLIGCQTAGQSDFLNQQVVCAKIFDLHTAFTAHGEQNASLFAGYRQGQVEFAGDGRTRFHPDERHGVAFDAVLGKSVASSMRRMPPALPRPPVSTCDLRNHGRGKSGLKAFSSPGNTAMPKGTGTPAFSKSSLLLCSFSSIEHSKLVLLTVAP